MPASMNCQDADEIAAGERIIDSTYKKLPYMQEEISFFMPKIDFTMASLILSLENKTLIRYDIFLSPWFLNGEDGLGKRRISHQCCEHHKLKSFPNEQQHRNHMLQHDDHILGPGQVYFHDLDYDQKCESALQYIFESRWMKTSLISHCACHKYDIEITDSDLALLHCLIADHLILKFCPECELAVYTLDLKEHQEKYCAKTC